MSPEMTEDTETTSEETVAVEDTTREVVPEPAQDPEATAEPEPEAAAEPEPVDEPTVEQVRAELAAVNIKLIVITGEHGTVQAELTQAYADLTHANEQISLLAPQVRTLKTNMDSALFESARFKGLLDTARIEHTGTTKELHATIAQLRTANIELIEVADDLRAEAKGRAKNALKPMSYHIKGVAWNGSEVRIVRCATGGDYGEKWMVLARGKMATTNGLWLANARTHNQVKSSLKAKVAFDFDAAVAFARKADLKKV